MVQGEIVLELTGNVWLSQEKSSSSCLHRIWMRLAGGQAQKQTWRGEREREREERERRETERERERERVTLSE